MGALVFKNIFLKHGKRIIVLKLERSCYDWTEPEFFKLPITPEEIQETALAAITKPLISAPNVKIKRLSDFGYVAT